MPSHKLLLNRFGCTLAACALSSFAPFSHISSAVAASEGPSSASATAGSIAVVLTPSLTSVRNKSSLAQEQGIDSNRELGWGVGLLFDAPLSPALSLGIGALYIERKFQIGTGVNRLERKVPTVFVPVEAKIWFGNILSIGAGVFGAVKVGDVTDSAIAGSGTLQSTSPSDHQTVEYGLTASANVVIPVAERTGLLVGARYLRGVNNGSKSALYDEKIDDLALQAVLSFSL